MVSPSGIAHTADSERLASLFNHFPLPPAKRELHHFKTMHKQNYLLAILSRPLNYLKGIIYNNELSLSMDIMYNRQGYDCFTSRLHNSSVDDKLLEK